MQNLNSYSNQYANGNIMPLLMSFTPKTQIQEETNPAQFIYNDDKQIVMYDMRTVGTYSLKTSSTCIKRTPRFGSQSKTDKKNEIDDSKNVK
jgi:translation elongation factor P/translation initiation factor 5A